MTLFSIASQKNQWLSARLGVVAGNVANATTPGYRARDVEPFAAVVERRHVDMARTHPAHLNALGAARAARPETHEMATGRVSHSGNTVSLEDELMKGAEIVRSWRLNTSIVKSFHRLFLMSTRDGGA